MTPLNVGFSNLSNDDIFHLALTVVHNVGNLPVFASLVPQLSPIATAAGALQAAMELPPGAVREQSIAAARTTLSGLLATLAGGLQQVTGVTDAQLAGSGFQLRQSATHTNQPTGVHLKAGVGSGTIRVMLSAVARAVMYEVQYTLDPVNGPWVDVPASNSTRGMMLTGLTRGKDYFVHVRAVATGQNRGPWSDIASAMAV